MIKSLKMFLESIESPLDISSWKPEKGTQLGSNEGGIHQDETGQRQPFKVNLLLGFYELFGPQFA